MPEFGPQPPRGIPYQDMQVLALQMDQWTRAMRGHEHWAFLARECTRFAEGDQYTADERQEMDDRGIPYLELNKIGPKVRLMYGFYRANRYEVRYLAGSDGTGDPTVADVLSALSKHIDTANSTKYLDAEVFDDGLVTGRGFWDIRLDFTNNVLGEIKERVLDPFSVMIDPEASTYEPDTWGYVCISRWCSLTDIQMAYGKDAQEQVNSLADGSMAVVNMEGLPNYSPEITPARFFGGYDPFDSTLGNLDFGYANLPLTDYINRDRKLVRVIETQHRRMKSVRRFVDGRSGQVRVIPDNWKRERIQGVLDWAEAHGEDIYIDKALIKAIRITVTAANVIVYDEWSPYRTFTVVPYFAQFRRGQARGMVKDLLDPQREINKRRSALLHVLMTAASSGWIIEEGSITEETLTDLETHGGSPGQNIVYKTGMQAPKRIEPAAVPQGLVVAEDKANADLNEISGINEAAMGQGDKVRSGRAEEARQRSAYIGAELYFDNFARSLEIKGKVRLALIQDYYTEARLFRVPDAAGKDQQIRINWQQASGEIENDINSGSYHTTVDTAPISATFQAGAFEEAKELKALGVPISPAHMLEMSSIPMKGQIQDEIAQQPPPPPPADQLRAQADMIRANNEMPIAQLNAKSKQDVAGANNAAKADLEGHKIQAEVQVASQAHTLAAQTETHKVDVEGQVANAKIEEERQARLQAANPSGIPGIHAMDIATQLQAISSAATAQQKYGPAVSALVAKDQIVNPLPAGAKETVSIRALPRTDNPATGPVQP